ncbi:FAD:protein FMN transferase [Sphingomonas sp. LaA6.9]|uniref:FAD:protein FMN transferase n=1 Tax=Sphingomonas sp. LaA6.9 TaxID=2919914 RepID=UPI001F4F393C|nr:FAD:protein FMN transferase [Sphingomonas sp. LaA6.9]MCJ8157255.1 FAD:protein FMN transferase [Sphingomonas sp. LaA6.9]
MTLQGLTMGTSWSVRLVARPSGVADAMQGIERVLDRVVAQMSNWETGSDISRFNRSTPGTWLLPPPEFLTVLDAALEIARLSDGAFDPAIGALVDLWGFGPAGPRKTPPADDAVADALARSGWRRIEHDMAALRARRTATAALDFSGIAKGFAVDRVSEWLAGQGLVHHLVEIGGELRGSGLKPDGQPWWVDLEAPPGVAVPVNRVALHGLSVATSGDYRRWFEHDGRRHAHSLDPRTGRPIANGVASVTVLHPSCMLADAWATALTVLGTEAGLALAEAQGLAARIIERAEQGVREWHSSAFRAMAG